MNLIFYKLIFISYFLIGRTIAIDFNKTPHCEDPKGFQVDGKSKSGNIQLDLYPELNQGKTGTCYLHSAFQIIQAKNPQFRLSLISFMRNFCKKDFTEGGLSYNVLYQIRKNNGRNKFRSKMDDEELFCDVFGLCTKNDKGKIDFCGQEYNNDFHVLFTIDNLYQQMYRQRGNPSFNIDTNFNIHVFQTYNKSKGDIIEKIENVLKSENGPISLAISKHEVALVGIAMVCCGSVCKKMALIRNSYGEVGSGWYDLNEIVGELQETVTGTFTFTTKCVNSGSNKTNHLPLCDNQVIFGDHSLFYLAVTKDKIAFNNFLEKNKHKINELDH